MQDADPSLQTSLNELLRDIADTVAAFDGRIACITRREGQCTLSFAGQQKTVEVTVAGTVKEQGIVEVELMNDTGAETVTQILYTGPFAPAAMYQVIGAGLAQWYGTLVRKQI